MQNLLKKPFIYLVFVLNLLSLSGANIKNINSKAPEDPLTGIWKGYLT